VEVQFHTFFDLGTRWRGVVSFIPQTLYPPGKSPWYPWDRRLGGLQSSSECGAEEKNSQPLLGLKRPIIQPIAIPAPTDTRYYNFFHILISFSLPVLNSVTFALIYVIVVLHLANINET
jgi:hypothetical protein